MLICRWKCGLLQSFWECHLAVYVKRLKILHTLLPCSCTSRNFSKGNVVYIQRFMPKNVHPGLFYNGEKWK